MQNKVILFFVIFLSFFPVLAQGQTWQGAVTLPAKNLDGGIFFQYYSQTSKTSSAFMTFGQVVYGQTDTLQLEGLIGIGMLNIYIGGQAKYSIYNSGSLALAVRGGFFEQGYLNAVFSFIARGSFRRGSDIGATRRGDGETTSATSATGRPRGLGRRGLGRDVFRFPRLASH